MTDRICDLAVAAAKVVNSPTDFVAAKVSLHALREAVRPELPHLVELIDSVVRMLLEADRQFGEGAEDTDG